MKVMTAETVEQGAKAEKKSQFQEVWRRFKKNRLALFGLVLIVVMILLVAFSGTIAPYGFDEQNYYETFQTPSLHHLCGTDQLGRDVFSRLLYGGRVSLTIGLISVGIGLLVGGAIGAIAGYYSGRIDNILMRFIDILMAIPSVLLGVSICAALGPGLINTMIAVGVSTIPNYARILRSSIMTIKQQEYPPAVLRLRRAGHDPVCQRAGQPDGADGQSHAVSSRLLLQERRLHPLLRHYGGGERMSRRPGECLRPYPGEADRGRGKAAGGGRQSGFPALRRPGFLSRLRHRGPEERRTDQDLCRGHGG